MLYRISDWFFDLWIRIRGRAGEYREPCSECGAYLKSFEDTVCDACHEDWASRI